MMINLPAKIWLQSFMGVNRINYGHFKNFSHAISQLQQRWGVLRRYKSIKDSIIISGIETY